MSLAEDIRSAAAEVGASAQAAAARASNTVGQLRTELADAQAQIQALIDAGNADSAALGEALATLQDADAIVDSIEAAPVEETPPVEEPPPA
jgi:hypothetical protein